MLCMGSSNSELENSEFSLMMNYIFCSEWQNCYPTWQHSWTMSELPDVGTKLEAWRLKKMSHNFLFLQSDVVFGIVNAFSWIFDAVSSEKSFPTLVLFLLTYIEFWLVNSNFICKTVNVTLTRVNCWSFTLICKMLRFLKELISRIFNVQNMMYVIGLQQSRA